MAYKYDYLIVGAGLYGATFARQMTDAGKKVLVIEKRSHIAGNAYTKKIEGIDVHVYGAHIMHTNNQEVWDYVQRFCVMNNYTNRVRVNHQGVMYSFPLNMNTLNQLFGVVTPREAEEKLESMRQVIEDPANLEEWMLSQVGEKIYNIFIKGYTEKQWGKPATELPASIVKRLPIRLTYNDNYFNDRFQGIPEGGYTKLVANMLSDIEVLTDTDYLADRERWNSVAPKIIYAGKVDEFLDYRHGELEWRSLRFETAVVNCNDYQGTAVVNYTDKTVPYTRILEHKHFEHTGILPETGVSVVTKEYPEVWSREKEAYYPVRDKKGRSALYEKYIEEAEREHPNISFKGRLAEYVYRDMCPTIKYALEFARQELAG